MFSLSSSSSTSHSSDEALKYLQSVKPSDGWKIPSSKQGVRLLRRNVPVSESYFIDIHLLSGNAVAGILSYNKDSGRSQAQELVDSKGRPVSRGKVVSIKTYSPGRSSSNEATASSRPRSSPASNSAATGSDTSFSDDQNLAIMKYGGMGLIVIMFLQTLKHAMFGLYILATPLLYLYLVSKCPAEESFDVKKEVKRVYRGHHLPEDDPQKPKGFLSETLARLTASVTTEVALSALGYEVTYVNLAGAAVVANVRVPAANTDFYWVGVHDNWYYVYSHELESATTTS